MKTRRRNGRITPFAQTRWKREKKARRRMPATVLWNGLGKLRERTMAKQAEAAPQTASLALSVDVRGPRTYAYMVYLIIFHVLKCCEFFKELFCITYVCFSDPTRGHHTLCLFYVFIDWDNNFLTCTASRKEWGTVYDGGIGVHTGVKIIYSYRDCPDAHLEIMDETWWQIRVFSFL